MKSVVRSNILQKLRALDLADKQSQSSRIQDNLKKVLSSQTGVWGAYSYLSDEPQIQWDQVSGKINWAFPKMQKQELSFVHSAQVFEKSEFGFMEPNDGETVSLEDIKGFVIPAVAYDKKGYRLGRGKGHYDRALQDYAGIKIGVCFNVSLCEELPREEHDIQCDLVVTEDHVYQTGRNFEGVGKWN
ncbi:5-formyltetrahydrofolate cyclo-ligase [Pseudobdellovibrio exovorus]|uniref:5-formyltetrahydrofolate cyclo-ligase n=1 Tax=Pseudobdellovibrio exovorus JSS TaxID=1184267 RepID=M4V9M7_9BACT|nr:5-formyltetrahydrofolate cyclo-ligase [Pseudobdellovibrio exovorus]AGH95918.1 hypothetical protein A11Q_1702 [Pseudobdellovibrio exovorus JSS]